MKMNTFNVLLKPVPMLYMNMEIVEHHLRLKTLLYSGTLVTTITKRFLDKHDTMYKRDLTQELTGIASNNNEKVEGAIKFQLRSYSKIFNFTINW